MNRNEQQAISVLEWVDVKEKGLAYLERRARELDQELHCSRCYR